MMLGFGTRNFRHIRAYHHRPQGAAGGLWQGRKAAGRAAYNVGYSPVFLIARALRLGFKWPPIVGGVGLAAGYLEAAVQRSPRPVSPALVRFVRRQQLRQTSLMESVWRWSLKVPFDHAAIAQSDHGVKLPGRNDAFSFWKLPEQWRPALESTIGPSEAAAERLLLEQYLPEIDRHPPSAMRAYYCVKGLIPQALRHRLNSVAIRARKPLRFPSWPCESALVEFWRAWLKQGLEIQGAADAWHIGFWPEGEVLHRAHPRRGKPQGFRSDGADGRPRRAIRLSLGLESAVGPIPDRLAARGAVARARLRIRRPRAMPQRPPVPQPSRLCRARAAIASGSPVEHDLRGFRSPSTLRDPRKRSPPCLSTSIPVSPTRIPTNRSPAEPAACFRFISRALIELPYTLPQDHTLIHLLHRNPLPVWTMKAKWIASIGGMILTLTHPDYCGDGVYLKAYAELLNSSPRSTGRGARCRSKRPHGGSSGRCCDCGSKTGARSYPVPEPRARPRYGLANNRWRTRSVSWLVFSS